MNNIKEKFEDWNLIVNYPREFHFWELRNKSNVLIILFKKFGSENELLKIEFSGILTYKYTLEAGRIKTINEVESLSVFNKVNNSEYLKWFKGESAGIFDDQSLIHIAICSSDCIIDIITDETPKVEWIYDLRL